MVLHWVLKQILIFKPQFLLNIFSPKFYHVMKYKFMYMLVGLFLALAVSVPATASHCSPPWHSVIDVECNLDASSYASTLHHQDAIVAQPTAFISLMHYGSAAVNKVHVVPLRLNENYKALNCKPPSYACKAKYKHKSISFKSK